MKTTRVIPLINLALMLFTGWNAYVQFSKANAAVEVANFPAVKYYFVFGSLSTIAAGVFLFLLLEAWREYEGRKAVCSMWEVTKRTLDNLGKISQESQKLPGVLDALTLFSPNTVSPRDLPGQDLFVQATQSEIIALWKIVEKAGHPWRELTQKKDAYIGRLAGNELHIQYILIHVCDRTVAFYWPNSDVFVRSACKTWLTSASALSSVTFMDALEFSRTLPSQRPDPSSTNEQGV